MMPRLSFLGQLQQGLSLLSTEMWQWNSGAQGGGRRAGDEAGVQCVHLGVSAIILVV